MNNLGRYWVKMYMKANQYPVCCTMCWSVCSYMVKEGTDFHISYIFVMTEDMVAVSLLTANVCMRPSALRGLAAKITL